MKMPQSLSGTAFDFLLMILLLAAPCLVFFAGKFLLFRENSRPRELTLISEAVPIDFEEKISQGDALYDTLTKREIGIIKSIEWVYPEKGVRFIIKTDARFTPRSDAVRTKALWFRAAYAVESE